MKLAIDLRLLNYKYTTGIGIYTLHFLYELYQLKNSSKTKLEIVVIGINKAKYSELEKKFRFLKNLFDRHLSLGEYLSLKRVRNTKLLSLLVAFKTRIKNSIDSQKLEKFDFLILPQPRLILKNPETKMITIFHDLYSILDLGRNQNIIQKFLENKYNYIQLAAKSFQVWGVSLATCKDISKLLKIDESKIKLVYPGIPNLAKLGETNFENRLEDTELYRDTQIYSSKYLLAVSGIEPRKNWSNLLLAYKYLQQTRPDYNLQLVLSGEPVNQKYYQSLIKLISNHKIKNVSWQISVSEKTKQKLIENCFIFMYPSIYEGFGFPILEAIKYNKPLITSKISSMPEVARNKAIFINPLNLYDIARAIYILQTDLKFRLELQQASYSNDFSWNELGIKLKKLISGN